ncbi:MAG: aminoacyl--tRNA ligase-related protein [Patescibacteria group bacterium]
MRQSHLFTKTRKEAPKDEVSKNAELLIRGGFINKELAGVYDFLPLGLIVLRKIEDIVREEMNKIGGQEMLLTVLQDKEVWSATDRWEDAKVDVWFKTELKNGGKLGLGFSHEEPLTRLLKDHIRSYKDLPKAIYQIQTKFRNEVRAKSGIMRGREFQMKDMYSFARDEKEHEEFYERAKIAYMNVFERLGLGATTFMTFASGGIFSKYSHEFQTVTPAGEDVIYVDEKKKLAVNKEVYTDEVLENLKLNKKDLKEEKAIEVGNIFSLGTRFSDALGLKYIDEKGKEKPVIMGCYGMGPSRLMGTVVEVLSDGKGIVWPESIAPFRIHLIEIAGKGEKVTAEALKILKEFESNGFEVLHDDRKVSAGEKLSDSDLLGIPWRVVISEKMLLENKLELKNRKSGEIKITDLNETLKIIKGIKPL